jgi:hypothetical protein
MRESLGLSGTIQLLLTIEDIDLMISKMFAGSIEYQWDPFIQDVFPGLSLFSTETRISNNHYRLESTTQVQTTHRDEY